MTSPPSQDSTTMSHTTPSASIPEDGFTPERPPQYKDSNQPGAQSPSSTDSTNTTLTAAPRPYIKYYTELDYTNPSRHPSTQRLTESALSAHDHRSAGPWGTNSGDMSYALSQYLSAGVMDSNSNMSVCRIPRTHTVARTGTASSRTMGAPQAVPVSQAEDMTSSIRAAGCHFDDISALPTGLALRHEDLE